MGSQSTRQEAAGHMVDHSLAVLVGTVALDKGCMVVHNLPFHQGEHTYQVAAYTGLGLSDKGHSEHLLASIERMAEAVVVAAEDCIAVVVAVVVAVGMEQLFLAVVAFLVALQIELLKKYFMT